MVTSFGNGWQSPPISFTFDFSQTEIERTTNDDWHSPRISFSLNLSQTDMISPEKRRREDATVVNYDTDFEFWVNGKDSIMRQTLLPVADELFVDGKMLPLIHGPVEDQPGITIARHLSLESLRCMSPVRSTSSSPSKIICSCWGNIASTKSLRHKPAKKWKEMVFKPSNKENVCAEKTRTSFKVLDQSQPSSPKSVWSFSRSCRTGGEKRGSGLFRSSRFSRSLSTAEPKYKAATSGYTFKEIEADLSGLVEGSKLPEAWSIGNLVQPKPQYYSELKPRFEAKNGKEEAKVKQSTAGRDKLGSRGLPASRMAGVMSSDQKVGWKERSMVRNWERSSSSAVKAARLGSPPPGKPIAEGSFLLKSNNSMGGVRKNPVVAGGSWNGSGGFFGFFFIRRRKKASAYRRHHSHGPSTNYRKKGT